MNLNEMQNAWNSPENNLAATQRQQLAQKFAQQMIRRRRFQAIWLANTFAALTAISALAARNVALSKVNTTQEWALLPLLLIPWCFAFVFLKRFFQSRQTAGTGSAPVADSLRQALNSNQAAQTHLKYVGVLYMIFIPVLCVVIQQLHAAGKVSGRELTSMIVAFGVALLAGGIAVLVRFFAGLRPQERQLRGLIDEVTGCGQ